MVTFLIRWLLLLLLTLLAGAVALMWALRMHSECEDRFDLILSWLTLFIGLLIGLQILLGCFGYLHPLAEGGFLVVCAVGSYASIRRRSASAWVGKWVGSLVSLPKRLAIYLRGPEQVPCVAWLCLCCVIAVGALAEPSTLFDSLAYHLPMVVEWAQNGWLTEFYLPMADYANSYFPGSGHLLYLWSFSILRSDLLVNLTNFGLWGLTGIALAFVLREVGVRPSLTRSLPVIFLLTPVALSQAVDQSLDLAGVAFFLLAFGYLTKLGRSGRVSHAVLCGTALGCTLGTKYSGPAYVVVLAATSSIRLATLSKKQPLRRSLALAASAILPMIGLGGFWYLRNYVLTGNPVFPMSLAFLGHTIFPGQEHALWDSTRLWNYLADVGVLVGVSGAFFRSYGAVAALVLPAGASVFVARLVRRRAVPDPCLTPSPYLRLCFAIAVLSTVLYLKTPYSIMRFSVDDAIGVSALSAGMRFALPGVAMWFVVVGLAFSSTSSAIEWSHHTWAAAGLALLQAVVVSSDHRAAGFFGRRLFSYNHLLVSVVFAFTTYGVSSLLSGRREPLRLGLWGVRRLALLLALAAVISGTCAFSIDQYRESYRLDVYRREYGEMANVWTWVRENLSNSRIAYSGFLLTYPLYGQDYSNRVRYINISGELEWRYHDFAREGMYYRGKESSYKDWVRNLAAWDADFLVVVDSGNLVEAAWASEHLGSFRLVHQTGEMSVYSIEVGAQLDPRERER